MIPLLTRKTQTQLIPKTLPLVKPKTPNPIITQIQNLINRNRYRKAASILFHTTHVFPFDIYTNLFKICSVNRDIVSTRKVESQLMASVSKPPAFVVNCAIECYCKCGSLKDAEELFGEMEVKDGGSWNAMLSGYCKDGGNGVRALRCFLEMNRVGMRGNEVTFACVFNACGDILQCGGSGGGGGKGNDLDVSFVREMHGIVVKEGFSANVVLASSLVDLYGKFGIVKEMRRMFNEIECPNEVSWNVIVRRYLEMGSKKNMRLAVVMFFKAVGSGNVRLLKFTFCNALKGCANIEGLKKGCQIHGFAVKIGFDEADIIVNALIDVYIKCGRLEEGRRVFDERPWLRNLMSWTSIVSGYAMHGRLEEATDFFNAMPERTVASWNALLTGYVEFNRWDEGLNLVYHMRESMKDIDYVTVGLIIRICAGLSDLVLGKQAHGFVYRREFFSQSYVWNALIDMYGKCGNLKSSKNLFYEMGQRGRDTASWNTLIASFSCHRMSEEVLEMFRDMLSETAPTAFTFSNVLAACANVSALAQGKEIHCYMIRNGYKIGIVIEGALLDMYSKCRNIKYVLSIFKESVSRDLILWNTMILACINSGSYIGVLELFAMMKEKGIKGDHVTFRGVLCACVNEGRVDLGKQYFESMSKEYCVIPCLEHYESIIELFSKADCIDELEDFVHNMPIDPTIPMLMRVNEACKEHEHSRLKKWVTQRLLELHSSAQ